MMLRALALLAVLLVPARAGDEAGDLARKARELRRSGHDADALALFDGRAPAVLADLRVVGEREQALLDAGRVQEALALDAALGEVPAGPAPLGVARARLATARGHPDAALAWLDSAGALKDNPDVLGARVEALLAEDHVPQAQQVVEGLPPAVPESLRARLDVDVRLARARAMTEDPDLIEKAIPLLEEALKLQPDRDEIRVELVDVLAQWHHEDRAEALAQEVLAHAQGVARAPMLFALGSARRAELRDDDAADCFQQVLALQPDNGKAQVQLARCRLRQGRDDEGLALLHQRLAARPHDPDALLALAEHELENREADAAATALHDVLAQRPQSLKAMYMLSRALALQGQAAEQQRILDSWRQRRDALAMGDPAQRAR